MSFDSYSGPSPWESTNNKKNPFDTEKNISNKNTDVFNSDKKNPFDTNNSLTGFNLSSNSFYESNNTEKIVKIKNEKQKDKFIYFNPEGLISTRKNKKRGRKIIRKYLKKKYKLFLKHKEERKTVFTNKDRIKDLKNDLLKKQQILEKDKQHNLSISVLKAKGKTREDIFKIINENNKPKFIKYEKVFIKSLPMEKVGNMTYCSRTARKNLYRLGVDRKLVPVGESAIASMRLYGDKENYVKKIDKLPNDVNVLDLFVDTKSKYEHRAAAYFSGGNWYVLDPYSRLKSNEKDLTLPIPIDEYVSNKKLMGVFAYSVNRNV